MKYYRYEPAANLKQYVNYYWHMENEGNEEQQYPDLLIPDGYPEIIFVFEGAYHKRSITQKSQITTVDCSSVIGIQLESLLVKRAGKIKLFGIKFKPLGFHNLLGEHASSTINKTISLSDFSIDHLKELEGLLVGDNTLSDAPTVVDCFLKPYMQNTPYSIGKRLTEKCIHTILETKGNLIIKDLSKNMGKSDRQIQRCFKEYLGLSPKKFANIIRFKSIYREHILTQSSLNHFFIHGYFDQNHFIKDFKNNLGVTPSDTTSSMFRLQHSIARQSMARSSETKR